MRVYFDLDRALHTKSIIDEEVAEYNTKVAARNHNINRRIVVAISLLEMAIVIFAWFSFFRHALNPEAWNDLHGPFALLLGFAWISFGVSVASFALETTKKMLDQKYRSAVEEYSPAARYLYEYQRNTIMETTGTCDENGKWKLIVTLKNPTTHTISTFSQDGFSKDERTNLTEPIFDLDELIAYFPKKT